jgi:ABC-type transport system involved in multi-copper enzyme maturation permease subunit
MDAPSTGKPVSFHRWLPYWAVLQADVQQTLRSWVYRFWVLVSVVGMAGYLLYRFSLTHELGIMQPASLLVSQLLLWGVLGSIALIAVLTAGSISSERGSLADSVLSRGISRYQYFLAKWHARLLTVLGTYLVLGLASVGSGLFLHEDLSLAGSLLALLTVGALLGAVVTCGVAASAVANNTLVAVTVLWMLLYGGGLALSLLPIRQVSPACALEGLRFVLRGYYNPEMLVSLTGWSFLVSGVAAVIGAAYFARRDV